MLTQAGGYPQQPAGLCLSSEGKKMAKPRFYNNQRPLQPQILQRGFVILPTRCVTDGEDNITWFFDGIISDAYHDDTHDLDDFQSYARLQAMDVGEDTLAPPTGLTSRGPNFVQLQYDTLTYNVGDMAAIIADPDSDVLFNGARLPTIDVFMRLVVS